MADSPQPPVDAAAPPETESAPQQDEALETGSAVPQPGSEPEDCVWLDLDPGYAAYGSTGLSGRVAALRAEAADLLGRAAQAVVDHASELAVGAGTAVVIGAGGWLVAAALTLAVWAMATPSTGSYSEPLHVAGQLWLAAHHVLLQTPDGPFGLSPLGFTILPAVSLLLAGRYAGHRFGAGIWAFAAVAACYPLAALVIAWSAAAGPLHAAVGMAAGYPCLIACCAFGAGQLSIHTPTLERWAATAVRAGTVALAIFVCGAALLAALAVGLRFTEVAQLGRTIGQGTAGDFGLFLIDLALAPNLVVWALSFAAGPGFAVGAGSSVSVRGSTHGALPGLPLLQAVPHPGAGSLWLCLVFAIPLLAGVGAVLIIGRSLRGFTDRAAALGAALPTVGALAAAGAVLSGGPVAAGAMSLVGPMPWEVGLAVVGELAFVAVVGFGVWYALDRFRGKRSSLPDAAVPDVAVPDVVLPLALPPLALLSAHDDGPGDLVGPGLALAVPERPEQVEDAGQDAGDPEDPVEEQPQEAETGADRLPVGEAGEPDAESALSVGLPGTPGSDGIDDGPDQPEEADEAEDDVEGVVAGGAGDPAGDDGDPVVEGEGAGALSPVGERGHADG
ncbi:MAG TPA: DUF6350 family protein [Actinocrinis sp.]|nr:DUF6350 family protein [Actinocrinis sp.]